MCLVTTFVFNLVGCGSSSPTAEELAAQNAAQKAEIQKIRDAIPPAFRPENSPDKIIAREKEAEEKRAAMAEEMALQSVEGTWSATITETSVGNELQDDIDLVLSQPREAEDGSPSNRRKDGSVESEEEARQRMEKKKKRDERDERRKKEARTSAVEVTKGKVEIELFKDEGFEPGQFKVQKRDGILSGIQAKISHPDGRVRTLTISGPFSSKILDGTIEEVRPDGKSSGWMILGSRQDR